VCTYERVNANDRDFAKAIELHAKETNTAFVVIKIAIDPIQRLWSASICCKEPMKFNLDHRNCNAVHCYKPLVIMLLQHLNPLHILSTRPRNNGIKGRYAD